MSKSTILSFVDELWMLLVEPGIRGEEIVNGVLGSFLGAMIGTLFVSKGNVDRTAIIQLVLFILLILMLVFMIRSASAALIKKKYIACIALAFFPTLLVSLPLIFGGTIPFEVATYYGVVGAWLAAYLILAFVHIVARSDTAKAYPK